MKIKIIHEDEEFLIIDKPFGIVVNRSESAKGETVQGWAEKYLEFSESALPAHDARQRNSESSNISRLLSEQGLRGKSSIKPGSSFSSFTDGQTPENLEKEFMSRGGVVHRLDKETSGILLIAKNPQNFLNL